MPLAARASRRAAVRRLARLGAWGQRNDGGHGFDLHRGTAQQSPPVMTHLWRPHRRRWRPALLLHAATLAAGRTSTARKGGAIAGGGADALIAGIVGVRRQRGAGTGIRGRRWAPGRHRFARRPGQRPPRVELASRLSSLGLRGSPRSPPLGRLPGGRITASVTPGCTRPGRPEYPAATTGTPSPPAGSARGHRRCRLGGWGGWALGSHQGRDDGVLSTSWSRLAPKAAKWGAQRGLRLLSGRQLGNARNRRKAERRRRMPTRNL